METWRVGVLGVHVAAGVTGLVIAWPILFAAKRKGAHTRLGLVYVGAVAVMCGTALVLAFVRPADEPEIRWGLASIAVVTAAWAFGGLRLARRRPRNGPVHWRVSHLVLMSSSVISFVTAFAVTMTDGHPASWIVPTVVGTPAIAWRSRAEQRRFPARRRTAAPAVAD